MTRGARREGLSRRHRFRGDDAFKPVLRAGRKLTGSYAVVHVAPAATSSARFGISVGKRSAKLANHRNLIKRRAREVFRRHDLKNARVDLVVTLTSRFGMDHVEQLMVELGGLLDSARARIQP